ncbi:MAG: cytochrome c [Gemmataceae bacterium]|nr:cytochrome c [Gemmataceae bacterium]
MGWRVAVGWAVFACAWAVAGCSNDQPKPSPGERAPEVLFEQHCAKCHARAGQPGGPRIGGSRGPDLAKIGNHFDADYLTAYIREPKSVRPDAKLMPAFGGVLTDEQIRILAEYLAARKDPKEKDAQDEKKDAKKDAKDAGK